MSGLVAERLFALLPRYMPLDQKYKLTEHLWSHIGPVSQRRLYVNSNIEPEEIVAAVKEYLEKDVLSYTIPERMEKRFEWLSQGDVDVKQQLLNFLRSKERDLAEESLRLNLPALLGCINNVRHERAPHVAHTLQVGKQTIVVTFTDNVKGISETSSQSNRSISNTSDISWIWWVIGILLLLILSQG